MEHDVAGSENNHGHHHETVTLPPLYDEKSLEEAYKTNVHLPHSSGGTHEMMQMFFHGGTDEIILFDFWRINSFWGLMVSLLAGAFLGFFYEGIKYTRLKIAACDATPDQRDQMNSNSGTECGADQDGKTFSKLLCRISSRNVARTMRNTTLYVIQLVVSYFLMLIAMTYNTWLFISVVFGTAVGYIVFGQRQPSPASISSHC